MPKLGSEADEGADTADATMLGDGQKCPSRT